MGCAVPTSRDCRESEGVPQIQFSSPFLARKESGPMMSRAVGTHRDSRHCRSGWSKGFFSTLLAWYWWQFDERR